MHKRTLLLFGPALLALSGCPNDKGTYDGDGDGYGEDVDCNDGDPDVNPGAAEVCDDGVDNDCDGYDDSCIVDADGDGVPADEDCDDHDATVYPGAYEDCYDGVDNDCNGISTECVEPVMVYEEGAAGLGGTYSTAIAADQIVFGNYRNSGTARFFAFEPGTVDSGDAVTTTVGEAVGSTFGVSFRHVGADMLCISADYFSDPVPAAGKSYCFSEARLRAEVGTLTTAHADFTVTGAVEDSYTTVEALGDLDGDGFDDVLAYTARGLHVILGSGTGFSGDYSVTDGSIELGACGPTSSIWCGYGRATLLEDPGAVLVAGDGSTDVASWFDLPLVGTNPAPDASYTIPRAEEANGAPMPTLSGFAVGNPAQGEVTLLDASGATTVLGAPVGTDFGYWVATGETHAGTPLLLVSAVEEGGGTVYVFDLDLTPLPTSTSQARWILEAPPSLWLCGWRTDVGVVEDQDGTHSLVSSSCRENGGAVYELDFEVAPPPPLPASAIQQVAARRYRIKQQAIDAYTSRVEWVQSLAQTERVPSGWRLHGIAVGSPLHRMGLRSGDVLTAVNDLSLSKVGAVVEALGGAKTLVLSMVRGGQSGTLRYDIVP